MSNPSNQPQQPTPTPTDKAGLLTELLRTGQLAWKLLTDSRVPMLTKLVPLATLLYILSPIDLIPDVILGLGQLDDLAVLLLGVRGFIALAPSELVAWYRQQLDGGDPTAKTNGETIDGTYKVVDDP